MNLFLKVGSTSCAQHLKVNDQSTSVALQSVVPQTLKENRLSFILKDARSGKKLDTVNSSVKKLSGKRNSVRNVLTPASACKKLLKSFKYAQ